MRRLLHTFLCALLLPAAAGAAVPDTRLLDSSPDGVRFEVAFGAPAWRTGAAAERAYRYPAWPRAAAVAEPGEPALPGRILRVALPPGEGLPELSVSPVDPRPVQGLRFPPVPVLDPGDPRPSPGRRAEPRAKGTRLEERAGYAAAAPTAWAEVLDVGVERGLRVARVLVRPVRWTPATGAGETAESVRLTLRVPGARTPVRVRGTDAVGHGLWRHGLVNPEDAARWQAAPVQDAPAGGIPERWYDDADGWVKIPVRETGLYRLTGRDLADLGVPVESIDPARLRLFSGPLLAETRWDSTTTQSGSSLVKRAWHHVYERTGFAGGFGEAIRPDDGRPGMEEVAAAVETGGDATLDDGDHVTFYALGPDDWRDRFGESGGGFEVNPYAGETVYWLGWNVDLPGEALRMTQRDAAPAAGVEPRTSAPHRVHFEENGWYDPSLYEAGVRWEQYMWERIDNFAPGFHRFDLPGRVAGVPFDLRVRIWGANRPVGDTNHNVRVTVNEVPGEVVRWGGGNASFHHQDIALNGLPAEETDNEITLFVLDGGGTNRIDVVTLAWFEAFYVRALDAGGESGFAFRLPDDGNGAARLAAPPPGAAWLLDVSDFRRPVRLTGFEASGGAWTFDPGRPGGGDFLAASPAARYPVGAAVDERPDRWLRDVSGPVDYLILAHDSMAEAAEELADWRRDHLGDLTDTRSARVRVVRVSDVYDEFSWGMADPSALRYFLEYAFLYYGGEGADPLSYVLFLGDHTYDPRDYEGTGVEDQIPSWEDNRDPFIYIGLGNVQWVSDDPLARFDGPDDQVTDLVLGRITTSTASEALEVIRNKVIANEANPDRGDWRTKAVLVADDICQGTAPDNIGFLHMAQMEDIDASLHPAFDRDKVYLYDYGEKCLVAQKPDAKRALLETWSGGAWLVNYIGHGADVVLADEHVFDGVDVPLLSNDRRLPLFNAFSCSVGKFSNPLSRGIGESLVRTPRGGALACAVATHLTFSGSNAILNGVFLERLFPAGPTEPVPVGAALMMAKNERQGSSEKYVCMGDPASRLNVPERTLVLDGPGEIRRGSRETLTAGVEGGAGLTGWMDLVVEDSREYRTRDSEGRPFGPTLPGYKRDASTLFRGRSVVEADTASAGFVVPLSLREGDDGRIRGYAFGEDWDALGVLADLDAGGTGFAPDDTLGPVIELDVDEAGAVPGSELTLRLEDPAGIDLTGLFDFRGILLKVRDEEGIEVLRLDLTDRFAYETGSFTRGSLTFAFPEVDPGTYEVVVSAFDNYTNKTEVRREVPVADPDSEARVADVYAFPNPLSESTTLSFRLDRPSSVRLRIYTVSGRLVWEDALDAGPGETGYVWDARDAAGDPVANGVYLLQLTARKEDGSEASRHLEKLVVYR